MKKPWFRYLLLTLLVIPLLLITVLAFVVSTQSGLDLLVSQAKAWAPGDLEIDTAEGRLIGPLMIDNLNYTSPEMDVALQSLSLQWTPSALFKRHVNINQMHAYGIRFNRKQTAVEPKEEVAPSTGPLNLQLPVSISIQDLSVTDTQLILSPDAEAVIIDSVTLSTDYLRNQDLNLKAAVASSIIDLQAQVHLDPAMSNAVQGELVFSLRAADVAEINGTTKLGGTLDALQITQRVESPYDVNASAQIYNALTDLSAEADIKYSIVDLSLIRADLPPMGIAGSALWSGTPTAGDANLKLILSNLPDTVPGDVNASVTVAIDQQLITLHSLETNIDGSPLTVNAQGTVELSSQPVADLNLNWQSFTWPLSGESMVTSRAGTIAITGDADNANLTLETKVNENGGVKGVASWMGGVVDADINWSQIQYPASQPIASGITGSAKLDGTLDAFKFLLNTTAETPELESLQLTTASEGSQENVNTVFNLQALEGALEGPTGCQTKTNAGVQCVCPGTGH